MRIIAHLLLFVMALAVFYFGLGVGLAFNPVLGTLLWLLAGAIGIGNIVWIVRRKR